MPTLAHEGNPKEAKIIIAAGDVLSTAQLDVDFLFLPGSAALGVVPGVPSTAEPSPLTTRSYTCGDVFDWPSRETGRGFLVLHDAGGLGAPGTSESLRDDDFILHINSTPDCYGIIWQTCFGPHYLQSDPTTGGGDILWQVAFGGVVDGTPRAGPCCWVKDGTTHASATIYALVVNMDTNLTELRSWGGTSLSSVANSTLLSSMRVPVVGEELLLELLQFGAGDSGAYGFIYNAAGVQQATCSSLFNDVQTFSISTVRHPKMGVGFVSIGGITSGHMDFAHRIGSGATLLIHNA